MVIFLTGVGTRALARVAETVCSRDEFVAALQRVPIVARGPKPVAALKEFGVPVTLAVPEPNTWRELLAALDANRDTLPLGGKRVAVQEYGAPNRRTPRGTYRARRQRYARSCLRMGVAGGYRAAAPGGCRACARRGGCGPIHDFGAGRPSAEDCEQR